MKFKSMTPLFPEQQLWGAANSTHTFLITKDPTGYHLSYKEKGSRSSSTKVNDYAHPFKTWTETINALTPIIKKLRQ